MTLNATLKHATNLPERARSTYVDLLIQKTTVTGLLRLLCNLQSNFGGISFETGRS